MFAATVLHLVEGRNEAGIWRPTRMAGLDEPLQEICEHALRYSAAMPFGKETLSPA